jgi:hypothetical protein
MYFKDQVMDINRNNYETFFLLYLDRELSLADRQAVEKFLIENTDLQKEFALLQQTIFSPADMILDDKESLLRKEEKRRVIPVYWMRMSAAIALLMLGSWFIISQITRHQTGNEIPAEQRTASNTGANKSSGAFKTDPANKNPAIQTKGEGMAEKNTAPNPKTQKEIAENRLQGKTAGQYASAQTMVSEEALAAEQKSSAALEIQSAGIQSVQDPKQMAELAGVQAPVLVLTASSSRDQLKSEKEDLNDPDFQNDNAISVIALNDQNKGIAGFFKKLTKRAPADDKERKVRVSVFQFSY